MIKTRIHTPPQPRPPKPAAKPFLNSGLILPVIIFMAVLMVGIRVNDMWVSIASGRLFEAVTPSLAQTKETPKDAAAKGDAPAPAAAPSPPAVTAAATGAATATPPADAKAADAKPAGDADKPQARDDEDISSTEVELVKQMQARREQLDKRSHDLDTREAVIKVAEQRVDQKIKEMETLRTQLQAMVNQGNEAQQAQLDNLVKIYETMKPKEAAAIFEKMDMPTLLGVVQKMKPARTAAVMAEMQPEKAKEVTVALTHQDQLPQVK